MSEGEEARNHEADEVEAVARAWWAHDPEAFDRLTGAFRDLQLTRAEAAIAALDAFRAEVPDVSR